MKSLIVLGFLLSATAHANPSIHGKWLGDAELFQVDRQCPEGAGRAMVTVKEKGRSVDLWWKVSCQVPGEPISYVVSLKKPLHMHRIGNNLYFRGEKVGVMDDHLLEYQSTWNGGWTQVMRVESNPDGDVGFLRTITRPDGAEAVRYEGKLQSYPSSSLESAAN